MRNSLSLFATISGFFIVAFGAFVAHGLAYHLSEIQLTWIEKGWRYQAFHSVMIFMMGVMVGLPQFQSHRLWLRLAGYAWSLGIFGFSFGLYLMALLKTTSFVMIVPIGGIFFLMGWVALFIAVCKRS